MSSQAKRAIVGESGILLALLEHLEVQFFGITGTEVRIETSRSVEVWIVDFQIGTTSPRALARGRIQYGPDSMAVNQRTFWAALPGTRADR